MYTLHLSGYSGLAQQLSFDPSSLALSLVAQSDKVGAQPSWITSHGDRLYVTDESEHGQVTLLSPSLEVLHKEKAGNGAVSSSITPDGKLLAVAN